MSRALPCRRWLNPLETINEEISLAGKYAQEDLAQAVAEARFIREENGCTSRASKRSSITGCLRTSRRPDA